MITWGGVQGTKQPNLRRDPDVLGQTEQTLLNLQRKEELILTKQVRQGTVVILGSRNIRVRFQ